MRSRFLKLGSNPKIFITEVTFLVVYKNTGLKYERIISLYRLAKFYFYKLVQRLIYSNRAVTVYHQLHGIESPTTCDYCTNQSPPNT